MVKKILFAVSIIFLFQLFANEELEMESAMNKICKNCIKVYEPCTGSYMEISLSEDEHLSCKDPEEIDEEFLSSLVESQDCKQNNLKTVHITDNKQVLEIYDYVRGQYLTIEISDKGVLKCKDLKIIKKKSLK